jgi:hypothetical protein
MSEAQNNRAAEVKATRRRRSDSGPNAGLKLAVPEELKEEGFEYRWINDDGQRIHSKTVMDDWDIVKTPKIKGDGNGSPVSRHVGKDEAGAPIKGILCRKPIEFYQEDKAKEQNRITERESSMVRGAAQSDEGLKGPTSYIPDRLGSDYSSDAPGVNRIGGYKP